MKKSLILTIILTLLIILIITGYIVYSRPILSKSKAEDLAMNRFKAYMSNLFEKSDMPLSLAEEPNTDNIRVEHNSPDMNLFYVEDIYEDYYSNNVWIVTIKYKTAPSSSFKIAVYSRSKIILFPDYSMLINETYDPKTIMIPTFI